MVSSEATIEVRGITRDEIPEWSRALDLGVLRPPGSAAVRWRSGFVEPARTTGAFEGARCVGTVRSSGKVLTVPGGNTVPAAGVTNVAVVATHRRRGLLRRMMARELGGSVERGEPASILIAAEYGIYGRFGYGHATTAVTFEVDVPRAQAGSGPPAGGDRIDLADGAEVRKLAPEMHDRFRAGRAGVLRRDETWWQRATKEKRSPFDSAPEPFHVLYRGASGRVDGLLTYRVDDHWVAKRPQVTLTVLDLVSVTPEAEAGLWRYAMSVDWVVRVVAEQRPPDDVLPLLLGDPRAAVVTTSADFMWLRPLDVPRLLAARRYAVPGTLTVEVRDAAGYAGGRYLLDGGPGGASCERTTRSADLSLDVSGLGALYLGEETVTRLAWLGRVDEERAGAVARADAMLRQGRRPWCPDMF